MRSVVSLMICCFLIVSGCGKSSTRGLPPTVQVTGQVTLDGKPVKFALITFSPLEPGPSASGQVVDGEIIDLKTSGTSQGVVPGKCQVTIYDPPSEVRKVDLIPDRYGRLDSELVATIEPDGKNVFEFSLVSDSRK